MLTQDSRKLWFLLSASGIALLICGLLTMGLQIVTRWTEARRDIYPWRYEDYLRFLLSSLHRNKGHNRILLLGGSDVREMFLYQRFDQAFPDFKAYQGGLSLATLDDILLTLNYFHDVHAKDALPRILILGITPRLVGNIPPDSSFLVATINRYCSIYQVKEDPEGSQLVPKGSLQSLTSTLNFWEKQRSRYRVALAALLSSLLPDEAPMGRWKQLIQIRTQPYKYHYMPRVSSERCSEMLRDPDSFWLKTHQWSPEEDEARIRKQFARLLHFVKEHEIELYVINLPEMLLSRQEYLPGRYETYWKLVRESLGATPLLDLREALSPEEFYDVGHPTLAGAERVTERVIEFVQKQREKKQTPRKSREGREYPSRDSRSKP